MRIDSFYQVQQMYAKPKTTKASGTNTVSFSDKLSISAMGKDIQTAKAAVNGAADVREDVVSSLRSSIKDGSYDVSNEDFASKIMEKYLQTF